MYVHKCMYINVCTYMYVECADNIFSMSLSIHQKCTDTQSKQCASVRVTRWGCEKNNPKCCPTHFCQIWYITLSVEKVAPTFGLLFQKLLKENNRRVGQKFAQSGHPGCNDKVTHLSLAVSSARSRDRGLSGARNDGWVRRRIKVNRAQPANQSDRSSHPPKSAAEQEPKKPEICSVNRANFHTYVICKWLRRIFSCENYV
jgi:hypothetical protein